jgi:hypothetical protein
MMGVECLEPPRRTSHGKSPRGGGSTLASGSPGKMC